MELAVIIIWLVVAGIPAAVACERGRSGLNWFLISFLLTGPVIALVILCSIERKNSPPSDQRPRTEEDDFYARYGGRVRRQYAGY